MSEFKIEDVRIDTYRPSGCGPQIVREEHYAVYLTHKPTGFVEFHKGSSVFSQVKKKKELMQRLKERVENE